MHLAWPGAASPGPSAPGPEGGLRTVIHSVPREGREAATTAFPRAGRLSRQLSSNTYVSGRAPPPAPPLSGGRRRSLALLQPPQSPWRSPDSGSRPPLRGSSYPQKPGEHRDRWAHGPTLGFPPWASFPVRSRNLEGPAPLWLVRDGRLHQPVSLLCLPPTWAGRASRLTPSSTMNPITISNASNNYQLMAVLFIYNPALLPPTQ